MLQKRLDLGCKSKKVFANVVVNRFDSETISYEQKALLTSIPDGKSKHAAEIAHAIVTVLFVRVDDGFSVRSCSKPMTVRNQICGQIRVIVDLSIKNDRNGFVFVENRLLPPA